VLGIKNDDFTDSSSLLDRFEELKRKVLPFFPAFIII